MHSWGLMVTDQDYDIRSYEPGMVSEAAALLKEFLGGSTDDRKSYLQWKYEHNPHTEKPLAVVALQKGQFVGFRGYFAANWRVGGSGSYTTILSPGDTFTHVGHRRRGLSVMMGQKAMDLYAGRYKFFLNLSATKPSVPGYLKMGYYPLTTKIYWNRYSTLGLMRFILNIIFPHSLKKRVIHFGQYGDIIASNKPRPAEMASIKSNEMKQLPVCLKLSQNENYFRWRFENGRNEYVFYYLLKDGMAASYLIVRRPPGGLRGYIIDYGAMNGKCLSPLLQFVAKQHHFDVLSIYGYSFDHHSAEIFRRCGFSSRGVLRLLEKKKRGEWPLFVRPVQSECVESGWWIDGIDIRKIDNWRIKEICSDSV